MNKVYQYSIKDNPTSEADWVDCSEHVYLDVRGYAEVRIIERDEDEKVNEWDNLWDEFKTTSEYKQSIAALQIRAYMDWLKTNFQAPVKK